MDEPRDHRQTMERVQRWATDYDPDGLDSARLLSEFVEQLDEAGLGLTRVSAWFPTSHPELWGEHVIWIRGQGAEAIRRDYSILTTSTYLNTPAQQVYLQERAFRWRLDGPAEQLPYDVLREIKALGSTDYYIIPFPLLFEVGWVGFSTDNEGGFSDGEMALAEQASALFGVKIRAHLAQHSLSSLLEIYLGPNAGKRVSDGQFKRGTGTTMDTVLWFCDLRNFTGISDTLPPTEVVGILDRYFEAVAGPIEDRGGEILKFIGDAVLAVFPCAEAPADAARRALEAAHAALQRVEEVSGELQLPCGFRLQIGVALHHGEVVYGNIGGRSRLDFTVIGAAVNEVCRIESLCKPLGHDLLVGDSMIDLLGEDSFVPLGEHRVKGVSRPIALYTPRPSREEASAG